jgi:hypothetical protein
MPRVTNAAAGLNRWRTIGSRLTRSTAGWLGWKHLRRRRAPRLETTLPEPATRPHDTLVSPDAVATAARPARRPARATPDEVLVVDARAALTPAQLVERKLADLLGAAPLPVSHLVAELGGQSLPWRPRRSMA